MNQTRAEEITMREDYGNINLETEDNGFGDGANAPGTPEMLRENDDFGPENISLAPPEVKINNFVHNLRIDKKLSMFLYKMITCG